MEEVNQNEDLANEGSNNDFHSDELNSPDEVVEKLKSIATSGTVSVEWTELQQVLTARLEKVFNQYMERNRDHKEEDFQEPNVEKFDMDTSRAEIMKLISSFDEPPFTIQRICELLYSPFSYYDRVSTFLRGLEKNLRVISSNDWSNSQVNSKNEYDIIVPVRMNESSSDPPQVRQEIDETPAEDHQGSDSDKLTNEPYEETGTTSKEAE